MARVASSNTCGASTLIADETTRRAVVPVLLDERATGRGEGALRRDLSLWLLFLFLYR